LKKLFFFSYVGLFNVFIVVFYLLWRNKVYRGCSQTKECCKKFWNKI